MNVRKITIEPITRLEGHGKIMVDQVEQSKHNHIIFYPSRYEKLLKLKR
jgi:coenzyme F420-reducing hydrogenase alpha subunit